MRRKAFTYACAAALVATATGDALATTGTALFTPVRYPVNTCSTTIFQNGAQTQVPVYSIIPSNESYALGGTAGGHENALSTYPLYVIFMGPRFTTTVVNQFTSAISDILSSSYLQATMQYGAVGKAYLAGTYVDSCMDLDTYEQASPPQTQNFPGQYPTDLGFNEVWRSMSSQAAVCPSGSTCCSANSNYQSWAGAGGHLQNGITDASNSAIYAIIYDFPNNTFSGQNGSNFERAADSNLPPINVLKVYTGKSIDLNVSMQLFSHELAERMSTGMGGLACSPGQISDGEPNDTPLDAVLNEPSAPLVQSYWSAVDQAFVVPGANIPDRNADGTINGDGSTARVLLTQLGVSSTLLASLREGTLSLIDHSNPSSSALADSNVQAFAIDSSEKLYDLTGTPGSGGSVKQFTGSFASPSWTAITGSETSAYQIVAPRAANPGSFSGETFVSCGSSNALVGGGLFMVASNSGANRQVWQYNGSGTNWTPLTGTNTVVGGLQAVTAAQCVSGAPSVTTNVYLLALGSQAGVWHWSGSGQNWTQITGSNTTVTDMVAANGQIYMLAQQGSGGPQIWQYSGSGNNWTAITPSGVSELFSLGGVLTADINNQLYQYVPGGSLTASLSPNWTPITGTNTTIEQGVKPTVQDGIELYMLGANDGGNAQVWEYQGIASQPNSTWGFFPLTSASAYAVDSLDLVGTALQMYAVPRPNGNSSTHYQYTGQAGLGWTQIP